EIIKPGKHPAVVVLNNGIGLVAYETTDEISVIKLKQFKTSSKSKLLPNREFNFGRLENSSKWTTSAKLYYYEDLPDHFLSGSNDSENPDCEDAIGFRSGPLQNLSFPLALTPLDEDENGKYIQFLVPTSVQ